MTLLKTKNRKLRAASVGMEALTYTIQRKTMHLGRLSAREEANKIGFREADVESTAIHVR